METWLRQPEVINDVEICPQNLPGFKVKTKTGKKDFFVFVRWKIVEKELAGVNPITKGMSYIPWLWVALT